METKFNITSGRINDKSCMYTFSNFVPHLDLILLLMNGNEESSIWHEIFGHLNFIYMYQVSKQERVKRLFSIEFSNGLYNGRGLGKHPQDKFEKQHG